MSFLNTVPLVWGLLTERKHPNIVLSMATPADCAEQLRKGEADLGLVPVAEIARQQLPVLPGSCISSDGPVRSILLISQKPWEEVSTLAGDANSRTSVVLAQIILRDRFGVAPTLSSQPPVLEEMLANADAALLIGDSALHVDPDSLPYQVLDLGEEWKRLTGLPMVFAAWAGPAALEAPWLEAALRDSLCYGQANVDDIVEQVSASHGVDAQMAHHYLTHHIRFWLEERELAGMAEFLRRARAHRLLPESAGAQRSESETFEEVEQP